MQNKPVRLVYLLWMAKKEMSCIPHVYHELSTIHEADSALTASSLQISQSKLSFEKSLENLEQEKSEAESSKVKFEDSTENLKMISLLDPLDSKVSELAKNIHFTAESSEEAARPFKVTKSFSSESSDAAILSKESLSSSHKSVSSSSPSFSNDKIYSSSLNENHAKYTHLKSTETFPKYFKDISAIQLKNISCSESSLKSSVPSSIIDTGIKASSQESSTNLPLVSGFIDNRKTTCASSSDSFQESSTNHPLVSGFISDMRKTGMSGSDSNHEYNSKHTLLSGFISDMKAPDVKSPDSFHPMTPHSNISSPDLRKSSITEFRECNNDNNQIVNSKEESFRYEQSFSPESGTFKPMTPHSNISSPSTVAQSKQQIYTDSSTESFKPMTPKSMVSSPSLSSDDSAFKGENPSIGSSKFRPVTFRLTIPVPLPISSVETGVKNPKIGRMPELRLDSKSEVHRHPGNMQLAKDPETGHKSPFFSDDEAEAYLDRKSAYQEWREKISSDARSKQFSRACSSDFFVPQISGADMISPQTQSQEFDLVEGSLTKSSQKEEQLQSNLNSQSSETSSSSSGRSNDKFSDLKYSSAGSVASYKTKMEEGTQEFTARRLANYGTKLDSLDLELPKVVKKQYASLQAISSTSSSSENLSDMFSGSKIMYQSTPIKSMEELAQEKGILEEPDLTLMATQITCLPDESELPRDPSCNTTDRAPINLNLEKDITLVTSPSESKTPTNQSLSPLGSCDTPSMRSFLRHEMSCMQGENSPDENSASEASKAQNEVQKSQKFPRVGYKLRTKRLWNNLEEVRKRNLAEERKKISSVNRLKAKEYAKKLTPKRKEN